MNETQHKPSSTAQSDRTDSAFDALVPAAMAQKAEAVGVAKAHLPASKTFVLAVLAGAFIGFGALFSTTTLIGMEAAPFGLARLVAGLSFSLGLILVVVGGAELFTGNNLIVMAWASGKVSAAALLRNWAIVYLGNFVGAAAIAVLAFLADQHRFGDDRVGALALSIAATKTSLPFMAALVRGVLCNVLVCLAVWLCMGARSSTDKILSIIGPITAFVAAGFEHSIANMYFVPFGLLIKAYAPHTFWAGLGRTAADYPHLTFERFVVANLLPVTVGNVLGGALLVGLVYWFVYLRAARED